MLTREDFYRAMGRGLLLASYSGPNPDGSFRIGPPPPDAAGKRMFLVPESAVNDADKLSGYLPLLPHFAECYTLFEDELSGQIMVLLLLRRMLGPERTALNISIAEYAAWMKQLDPMLVRSKTYNVASMGMILDLYDLRQAGIPIRVNTTRSSLLAHFFLKQYGFERNGVSIAVEPGDTVIEGGMCFGDTALFFAHLAGESGRVIGFEFELDNLKILADNFGMNPELAKRISVRHNALADVSDKRMMFAMAGPATTSVTNHTHPSLPKIEVPTLTIDDLVDREGLERVDFIKLDIEGSELATMRGAERTLRKFRPKLALSAYHKVADIPELMGYVRGLDLGYRFWLDHFRAYDQETMLFADAR